MDHFRPTGFKFSRVRSEKPGRPRRFAQLQQATFRPGVQSREFQRPANKNVGPVPRARVIQLEDVQITEDRKDKGIFNIRELLGNIRNVLNAGNQDTVNGMSFISSILLKFPPWTEWSDSQEKEIQQMLGVLRRDLSPAEQGSLAEARRARALLGKAGVAPLATDPAAEARRAKALREGAPKPPAEPAPLPSAPPAPPLEAKEEELEPKLEPEPRVSAQAPEGQLETAKQRERRLRKKVMALNNNNLVVAASFFLEPAHSFAFTELMEALPGSPRNRNMKLKDINGRPITGAQARVLIVDQRQLLNLKNMQFIDPVKEEGKAVEEEVTSALDVSTGDTPRPTRTSGQAVTPTGASLSRLAVTPAVTRRQAELEAAPPPTRTAARTSARTTLPPPLVPSAPEFRRRSPAKSRQTDI